MSSWLKRLSLFSFVFIFGCKADPVEPYRAAGIVLFGKLAALASQPMPALDGGNTLKAPDRLQQVYGGNGNFGVYAFEALGTPEATFLPDNPFDTEFVLQDPARWVRGEPIAKYTPEQTVIDQLRSIASLKYVLVVKTLRYLPPVVQEDSFVGGLYVGDAHLFDLDGKYFGGVRFGTSSSDKVEYRKTIDAKTKALYSNDVKASVQHDLDTRAWNALRETLTREAPGTYIVPH